MKYFAIAAAVAVLSLSGCVMNRAEDYDPAVVLAFCPHLYAQVKASDGGSYPEDRPFGVSAWMLPEGLSFVEHSARAEEYLTRCEIAFSDGRWQNSLHKEWSPKTTRLSFIGYSPYGAASGCDPERGVTFTDFDTSLSQTDLLYTDLAADRSKAEGEVSMSFRHALCKVSFKVKSLARDDERIIVRSITLDSAATCGTFRSLPEPVWQLDRSRRPVAFFEGETLAGRTPCEIGCPVLMLPQRLATAVTVEYDFITSGGVTLHQKLSTKKARTVLEAGRRYEYTLSLGIDEVKFLSEAIDNRLI